MVWLEGLVGVHLRTSILILGATAIAGQINPLTGRWCFPQ
jgi:hypothetical protein